MQALAAQLQALLADNAAMALAVRAAQAEAAQATVEAAQATAAAAEATAAAAAGGGASGAGGWPEGRNAAALVSKWTPSNFSGEREDWRSFSVKFRSFVGQMLQGVAGQWLDWVRDNREQNAKMAGMDARARPTAALLYSSLIATCEGKALPLVERAGEGEGLEAWRLLLGRYDQQTRQSRVMRLIQLLSWEFKGDLLDSLESFDRACLKYTEATKKELDDDMKIGVVIKGMEAGALREHMLLHSEKAQTYQDFRSEVDLIAKARAANLMTATHMDIGAVDLDAMGRKGGGGKGTKPFTGTCFACGKTGHRSHECRSGGAGAGKGAGKEGQSDKDWKKDKECFSCGKKGHFASDCRASEKEAKAYKAKAGAAGGRGGGRGGKGGRKGAHELEEEGQEEQWAADYLGGL